MPCHLSKADEWKPWPDGKKFHDFVKDNVVEDDITLPEQIPADLLHFLQNCTKTITVHRRSTCGHKYQLTCDRAFKNLSLKKTKCEDYVQDAKLICGHVKTLKCWEYEEYCQNATKFACVQAVEKQCWNYNHCQSFLKTICKDEQTILSCDKLLNWNCDRGHLFENMPLCKIGIPKMCPKCILDEIDEYSDEIYKDMSVQSIINKCDVHPILQPIISIPAESEVKISKFRELQTEVLENYSAWQRKLDPWKRQVFMPHLLP